MQSPSDQLAAKLPPALKPLSDLAANYWWSWNNQHWSVFEALAPDTWMNDRNPWKLLNTASDELLADLAADKNYLARLSAAHGDFVAYMNNAGTWYSKQNHKALDQGVVYFCAEFAIHESLPIYSGGLGVLAGDHVKSASDLGIPETFIGLFYSEGYFEQQIDGKGHQVDVYRRVPAGNYPLTKLARLTVPWGDEEIQVQAWRADVGRSPLYLLDFDLPENREEIRAFSRRLYGGDRTMRLAQEVVLGIGGQRLLETLNLKPRVYHMNEGHSCLFQVERMASLLKKGFSLTEATEILGRSTVFTTHTPVPAGNEAFALPLLQKYLSPYLTKIGWPAEHFLQMGLVEENSSWKFFSMTVFALRSCRYANAVSELHGKVARRMWNSLWKNAGLTEVPITHITNGVHVPTWTSAAMKRLFNEHMGQDWPEHMSDQAYWERAKSIPDNALVTQRVTAKRKLIELVRARLKTQLERAGEDRASIEAVDSYFNERDLIIGFARRFATYKRATMLLSDVDRLKKIVNQADRPVRFLFAGKAHPMDKPGQAFIEKIYELSRHPDFRGKVIMLEGYDMNISSHMVAGCDVWLNNPRRPYEASGTSGQKVPLNGGMNFSVLDGWWREGFNGNNGWSIGRESDFKDESRQDQEDTASFYSVLEEKILPLYFSRKIDNYYSQGWLDSLKESLSTLLPRYSTHRMVQDYVTMLYAPSATAAAVFDAECAKDWGAQGQRLTSNWSLVHFTNLSWPQGHAEVATRNSEYWQSPLAHVDWLAEECFPGRRFANLRGDIQGEVYLAALRPADVLVELVATMGDDVRAFPAKLGEKDSSGMSSFLISAPDRGEATFRLRVRANLGETAGSASDGMVLWY